MTESQVDTINHIAKVQSNLSKVIYNLNDRRTMHDRSKLEEPELSGYEGLSQALKVLNKPNWSIGYSFVCSPRYVLFFHEVIRKWHRYYINI